LGPEFFKSWGCCCCWGGPVIKAQSAYKFEEMRISFHLYILLGIFFGFVIKETPDSTASSSSSLLLLLLSNNGSRPLTISSSALFSYFKTVRRLFDDEVGEKEKTKCSPEILA
jgi:hypothetical protein